MSEQVTNGGFDTDLQGWTQETVKANVACRAWIYRESSGGQSGGYAAMEVGVTAGGTGWANASISQSVNLSGVSTLEFYVMCDLGGHSASLYTNRFSVEIDGSRVYTTTAPYSFSYWTKLSIDVSGYSGYHTITFYVSTSNDECRVNIDSVSAISSWAVPVAGASASPTSGDIPLTVSFTNSSTGTPAPTYLWDFGDGITSSDENPIHTYNQGGTFKVTLTATNPMGSSTYTLYVTATAKAPEASFTVDEDSGSAPLTVTFTNTSTGAPAPTYLWSFGDGTTSEEKNPTHTYTKSGRFTASLRATNSGGSSVATEIISVSGIPSPDFKAIPPGGGRGTKVKFTNMTTAYPEITVWNWWFEGGDHPDDPDSTEFEPEHTYNEVGKYTVRLRATNDEGTVTKTIIDCVTITKDLSTQIAAYNVALIIDGQLIRRTGDISAYTDPEVEEGVLPLSFHLGSISSEFAAFSTSGMVQIRSEHLYEPIIRIDIRDMGFIEFDDIPGFPDDIYYLSLYKCENISDSLGNLPMVENHLSITECPLIHGVLSPSPTLKFFYAAGSGMSSEDTDQTLINIADTTSIMNGTIRTAMNRTSASDAAVAKLQALGWNVV